MQSDWQGLVVASEDDMVSYKGLQMDKREKIRKGFEFS